MIDTPQLSDLGGWRVTGQYIISIRRAQDDFAYLTDIPPDSLPYNEYQLLINYNWYKVVLTMPDGRTDLRSSIISRWPTAPGLRFCMVTTGKAPTPPAR